MNATKTGCKTFGDGSSWISWAVFPRIQDETNLASAMEQYHFDGAHYSGPGATFSKRAMIRHSRSRTLISQYGGYDV